METADTYIANSQLYVDVSALTQVRDNAKKIIDSYDGYAAGYDLTDINTESDITFDEEKPAEKSPLEIFKTIIEKLVSIINEIISYFTKAGARI